MSFIDVSLLCLNVVNDKIYPIMHESPIKPPTKKYLQRSQRQRTKRLVVVTISQED